MTERILTNERKEFLVSLSVAILVSNERSEKMLLVKNRQTGKWGPPAGGLQWLDEKDRLETPFESAERELLEETGVKAKIDHNIRGMINLPGAAKNRLGFIFETSINEKELKKNDPTDVEEIEDVRFFNQEELLKLLNEPNSIYRPEFNRALIIFWLRSEHRDAWDDSCKPLGTKLTAMIDSHIDELYLQKITELDSQHPGSVFDYIFKF